MGSPSESAGSNGPSDSRDSGSDDNRPDRESFSRAVEDNSQRPDRAPASTPESSMAPDDNEDDNLPDNDNSPSSETSGTSTPSTPDATDPDASEPEEKEDDRSFFDRAGDFFGGLARDVQDFARENPRVDSYSNPVGLVDADGIQRGEVASRVRSSGTSSEDLAEKLGFSSPQEMAAAQNTDFIDNKYQQELARRAIEAAAVLDERYGQHPEILKGLGPVFANQPPLEDLAIVEAMRSLPPDKVAEAIAQAKGQLPDIPADVWEKTEAVMKGALDGSVSMLGLAAAIAQTDSPLPGPADLVAVATVIAGGIAGGVDAYQAYDDSRTAEFGSLVAEYGYSFSNPDKLSRQMQKRGWTEQEIIEALQTEGIAASGKKGDATRYEHPTNGKSIVVDNVTNEIFHVGKKGYEYDR